MLRRLAAIAATLSFAVATMGQAGRAPEAATRESPPVITEELCGKFVGVVGSRVCLKTITQGENLKRVEDFAFRGLPAECGPAPRPKISGRDAKIDGDGRRFTSHHPEVLGGFSAVNAKIVGMVTDGGDKAKGIVRVRGRNSLGEPCDTHGRKWRAA